MLTKGGGNAMSDPDPPIAKVIVEGRIDQVAPKIAGGGFPAKLSDWLTFASKGLLFLSSLTLLVGFLALVVNAWGSRGIVIEKFELPPSFRPEGLSSESVSVAVVRRLSHLRAEAEKESATGRSQADVPTSDWLDDSRVEVPRTGITLGDMNRMLRRVLGSDIHVSAAVHLQHDGAPLLYLLIDGRAARRPITGRSTLIEESAEALYQEAYPFGYAMYLLLDGKRHEEGMKALHKAAYETERQSNRPAALNAFAAQLMTEGHCAEAIPVLQRALRLDRNLSTALFNLSNAYYSLGRDQESEEASRLLVRQLSFDRPAPGTVAAKRHIDAEDAFAGQHGDYGSRLRLYERMEDGGVGERSLDRAIALADNHDVRASLAPLPPYHSGSPTRHQWLSFKQAWALGEWAVARDRLARLNAQYRKWNLPYVTAQLTVQQVPLEAMAAAWAGDIAGAEALLAPLPVDCYLCTRARAIVAEAAASQAKAAGRRDVERRQRESATAMFKEAIRQGPRLPWAYQEWGTALYQRGDLAAARSSFRKARRFAPNWADPFKGEGDVLLTEGHFRLAAAAYAAAAERAPGWGGLYLDWGKSLWFMGSRAEALEMFRRAASVGLSPAEFARAQRLVRAGAARASLAQRP
jgi:tetratricopeptide (TPR) repeat protein